MDKKPDDKEDIQPANLSISKDVSEQKTQDKPGSNKQNFALAFVLFSFVLGFLGGWTAIRFIGAPETKQQLTENRQEIVVQEGELISDIADKISPSVVSIAVESTSESSFFRTPTTQESAGTGIILSSDGLVLTNKHVVPKDTTNLSVVLSDGTEYTEVEIIGRDPFNDIAYLKIKDAKDLKPATIGDSSNVRVGEKVLAIGNALGQFKNTVTSGIISGIGRPIVASNGDDESESLQNLFQTDAAINPGNSGGPLVNMNGEVIGINTAVAGGAENIGFAIPVNDVKNGIDSVKQNGKLVRPYLGVRYVAITDDIAKELDLPVKRGAYVYSTTLGSPAVIPNSPADKAGVKSEDIITKIADKQIDENNPLITLVGNHKVGDTIKITILRDGEEKVLDVTLEAAPSSLE
ncbi:PDZ domain-containing protein [Candidatus Saccharibacteria bacterium CPR2]|nr:PDZ domain-containing protein [Candidatus Saccharibacteria bacterium CPR2]